MYKQENKQECGRIKTRPASARKHWQAFHQARLYSHPFLTDFYLKMLLGHIACTNAADSNYVPIFISCLRVGYRTCPGGIREIRMAGFLRERYQRPVINLDGNTVDERSPYPKSSSSILVQCCAERIFIYNRQVLIAFLAECWTCS